MELKPTQIEVLRVLNEHDRERMGVQDILKYCRLRSVDISNAIRVLANNDYVYQPDFQGKVMISGDGKSALLENIY